MFSDADERGLEPPYRGRIDVVGPSDVRLRLASGKPCKRFLPLMWRELRWSTEPNTPCLCTLAACQSAFKFDPVSASNFDPLERRVFAVALAPSELVGVAETVRARAVV